MVIILNLLNLNPLQEEREKECFLCKIFNQNSIQQD